jgi:hypothetical protein
VDQKKKKILSNLIGSASTKKKKIVKNRKSKLSELTTEEIREANEVSSRVNGLSNITGEDLGWRIKKNGLDKENIYE